MEAIESNIKLLLNNKSLRENVDSILDYSIKDQYKELADRGIESQICDYRPICRKTVTYIAAGVIFNDAGEILLMQEAKPACSGKWYLPAGRVECGEDLCDAVKREVKEETGLIFEPSTLVAVESAGGNWYRFAFTGSIAGGNLKTRAEADSESLQAQWVKDVNQLPLRSNDIIPLIEKVREHWKDRHAFHQPLLPVICAHNKLLLRLIMIIKKRENNKLHVLVSLKSSPHLPLAEIHPTRSIHSTLKRFIQTIFNQDIPSHKPHGLLSIEHSGNTQERDGLCFTLLVSCRDALEKSPPATNYTWTQVDTQLEGFILSLLPKNKTLALMPVR